MRCPVCLAVFRTRFGWCPADGAELAPCGGSDPLLGSELAGRYIMEELVGEGSMGLIYRARHTCLPRCFAVKILFGDLIADPRMRIRFAQEAALASRLSHANVVPVVDFGRSAGGLLYLVMDFIEGEGLGELIAREAPLDPLHAIGLSRQLAQGLAHAHRRGLVHRDFKPNNVILERHEDAPAMPRILDFGLAISTRERDDAPGRLTEIGYILGTPIYIAPEQVLDHVVDHRADLFALGVVMYEMLAGVPPFDGRPVEIAHKNVIHPVPLIAQRSPGVTVPPELEAVVRRLLEKAPERRYATADELCGALDEVERGLAPRAARPAKVAPRPAPAREDRKGAWQVARTWVMSRPGARMASRIGMAAALMLTAGAVAYALTARATAPGLAAAAPTGPAATAPAVTAPAAKAVGVEAGGRASAAVAVPAAPAAPIAAPATYARAAHPVRRDAQPNAVPRAAPRAQVPARAPAGAVSRAGGDLLGRAGDAAAQEGTANPELFAASLAGHAALADQEVSARARDGAEPLGPRGFGQGLAPTAPAPGAQVRAMPPVEQPRAIAAPRPSGPVIVPPHRTRLEGGLQSIRLPSYEKAPGQVTAKLCIDARGNVTSVSVLSNLSSTVRDRVQRALSRSRFRPVVEGDRAVAACFATVFRVQVD
jgi:serine/threonine-protein kinase